MFGWIKSGLAIIGGALDVTKWFQKRSERNEYREAGRNEQRLEQQEDVDEARNRMDRVKPADSRATARKLRRGKF